MQLPTGPGSPYPAFRKTLADITERCQGIRSLTAELSVSGRLGERRVRGRVLAGVQAPDSIRLEGLAPFGAPGFIVAASPRASVLLLPRDDRVLLGAEPAAILDALVGLRLEPDQLLAVATGCITPSPEAQSGRTYPGDWIAIHMTDGSTAYLRDVESPRLVAGLVAGLRVEYRAFAYELPQSIRLQSLVAGVDGRPLTDVTVTISQFETNRRLGDEVFEVVVPASAFPITLEELRGDGPLGVPDQPTPDPEPVPSGPAGAMSPRPAPRPDSSSMIRRPDAS